MPHQETNGISSHIIESFEVKALKKRSLAVRIADDLTSFFGSMFFLVFNTILFVSWILINTGKVSSVAPFDPFPFQMLTTVVSLEAIVLTVIVLMSQNRQSLVSSLREEVDFQVNLMAEKEITKVLQLLKRLLKERGIKIEDQELEDMLKEIDASYIERKLEEQLTPKPKTPKIIKRVSEPIEMVSQEVEKVTQPIKEAGKELEKTISS